MTRDRPSAPPSGDGAQISLTHVSFAILQLEFSGTYRVLFQHPLQPSLVVIFFPFVAFHATFLVHHISFASLTVIILVQGLQVLNDVFIILSNLF